MLTKRSFASLTLGWAIVFAGLLTPVVGAPGQMEKGEMAGYLLVPHEKVGETYNAGFSIYAAAWPLLQTYPGHRFQTGLFGTWMFAQYDGPAPEKMYSDIEGGLGWWTDTRFATETPKFIMGGVAPNFVEWANGPGAGQGRDWAEPKGHYGVAQLSPWLLWPPDGLNLRQGTCGQLLGYGYLALPLTSPKSTTSGKNVPTGNNCWTLFLNTRNFKGPVAFFTPYFWSHTTVDDPRLAGMLLDSRPAGPNRAMQMETQYVPSVQAKDATGETYARIAPTSFPRGPQGDSVVLHHAAVYNKRALWDAVQAWFEGGTPASGAIDPAGTGMYTFSGKGGATWRIYTSSVPEGRRASLVWTSFATPVAPDPSSFGYRWNEQLVTRKDSKDGSLVTLPEYYHLVTDGNKKPQWIPVLPKDVPAETGLAGASFPRPVEERPEPYVTPDDPASCWKKPGPVAGPFQAHLGDHSVVTYYWYRFADQPALLNADLTKEERESVQARVEKIHRNWTKDRDYLAPPAVGELAEIDPALIVTPPKGLEAGYVPIATRQAAQDDGIAKQAGTGPIKVFILAGQSNMEGQGVADLDGPDYNDGKGTLNYVMKDAAKAQLFKHLKDNQGCWTVRDDVWVWYKPENDPVKAGSLTLGYTVYDGKHHFGPELQFGHIMGDHFTNQVLLIKTAWGGKSLYQDFRPPSSGGKVGPYYTKMVEDIREALGDLRKYFPNYDGSGYELAGFVWYHGWNDGCDPEHAVPEYEQSLVNLIKDLRKDLNTPDLPVVIGELTGPWVKAEGPWAAIRKAQADAAARPEFKGTVRFVETHDFVRRPEDSPCPGHGHHEFANAETYFLVGNALGEGMKSLLGGAHVDDKSDPSKPTSRTVRNIEGWTVRIDDRLLTPPHDALGTRAIKLLEAKLADITFVVPADPLAKLQTVPIVLDLTHGKLRAMQYHPSPEWLQEHGYARELAKCVHICEAADFVAARQVNEQPWAVLHELAHAYHDQVLGFDDPRIVAAYERFKQSGHGDSVLLITGQRVRHYGLTDPKEFFAEMTEAYFGMNDFFPFNRAELMTAEPEIFELLKSIWGQPAPVKGRWDRLASTEFGVEALFGNRRCGTGVGGRWFRARSAR